MAERLAWLPKPARRGLLWLVVVLVVGYVLVPQLADAGTSLERLGRVEAWLLALGVVLHVASTLSQTALTRAVLPPATRPGFGTLARVELASIAVSHTVPGGTAAGTALGFRLLTIRGVSGPDAGFAVGVRGIGSAVVLNVLLWLALVVSIPRDGFDPLYTVVAGLGAVLLAGFAGLVVLLMRHEARAHQIVWRIVAPIPFLDEERVPQVVAQVAERLRDLAADRPLVVRAVGWSAGYWLMGAASLWVFLSAFDEFIDPASLMVAFGLANVLAAIPITPRGLGVVEATLIPLLIGFGGDSGAVALAVLGWRFISFWLPIPAGGLSYVSLRVGERAATQEQRRAEIEAAYAEAERLDQWASRHGIKRPR